MTQRTMTWLGIAFVAAAVAAGTVTADEKTMATEKKMADKTGMTTLGVGNVAPDFTGTDQHGNEVNLSDHAGKIVVLEWTSPACPFVVAHYSDEQRTMTKLSEKYGDDVVWLAIDSSNFAKANDLAKWSEDRGIDYPIIIDPSGSIGQIYGAKTTPHMFVIDTSGTIVYEGAIDNNPRGQADNPTNYVETALDAIVSGEKIATTTTKPYGCSVKYAKGA